MDGNDAFDSNTDDGNCLYDALVKSTGIDMSHEELQRKI